MSLKAKLEAVIYAAEEPVTLAQLAALFAAEALEYKAVTEEPVAETLPLIEEPAPVAEQAADAVDQTANVADAATPEAQSPGRPAPRDREVKAVLKGILTDLIAGYEADDRGVEIREIAGGYRMATKPACHDAVRLFVKSLKPPLKLSLPALETLAVIAYKQPVTAPEVSEIRGVESGGVLGSLMARKLIATAGRKQVIGRPILYKTTKEFLLRFGLKDLSELPSMEEFEKIAAVEIDEMEPAETALSENASNPEEAIPDEPSQQAEIEAAPDAPEEDKRDTSQETGAEGAVAWTASPSEEVRSEEGSGEEIRSKESSGEEGSQPNTEESR